MVYLILYFQVSQFIFEQSPGKNIEKGLIICPFNLNLWLRDSLTDEEE